ncbi:MAG: enoyl-CoA hydratase/isomerase family protein [Firmicutes bacterium]|nr:enoyl-CoA hydratase/isomerase family protein [Bacillota bacterium]
MGYRTIRYETQGHVAILILNRPEVMNAVNAQMTAEAGDALETFAKQQESWVCVITGTGDRAFCAGADLKEVGQHLGALADPGAMRFGFAGITQHFIAKPLIAAVNGFALGGGTEIALACDLVIACEQASFGLPEVKRGILAAAGGLLRLQRQIPLKRAAELIFTGEPLSAAEAYRLGLVNRVVPPQQLMDEALSLAHKICEAAPLAVQSSKEILYRSLNLPLDPLTSAWDVNAQYLPKVFASQDAKEGVAAFNEKRPPHWSGR